MSISLNITDNELTGDFSIKIPPGTLATKRDAWLDDLLREPLFAIAEQHRLVLAAEPHSFARPLDGLSDTGETRFRVRGRVEAGRLLPNHRTPSRKHA